MLLAQFWRSFQNCAILVANLAQFQAICAILNSEGPRSYWTFVAAAGAESPVFTGLQAQKRTSVDALRCVFGGAGGI